MNVQNFFGLLKAPVRHLLFLQAILGLLILPEANSQANSATCKALVDWLDCDHKNIYIYEQVVELQIWSVEYIS